MYGKVDALVLNVRESSVLKVANQMRRHPEDAADLIHLELPRFEELCLVIRDAQGREGHALFKDRHTVGIGRAAIG